MVNRPNNLEFVEIKIRFNSYVFSEVEIDLDHVNKNGRSSYSAKEVAELTKAFLNNKYLRPSSVKEFGEECCSYFVVKDNVNNDAIKLVICVCSDKPTTIGVITLFKEN